jgi:hypothetical protein
MAGGKDSQSSTTIFALSVSKDKFHIRLKTSKEKYPVVSGFDKDSDGLPGEVEASGKVRAGDFLKSVNGIRLVFEAVQDSAIFAAHLIYMFVHVWMCVCVCVCMYVCIICNVACTTGPSSSV